MLEQEHQQETHVELGRLLATPRALEALAEARVSHRQFLARHRRGDWGELDKEDIAENELSLREGFRLLSQYTLPTTGTRIWIITEADRSITTILLPEDY